MTQEKETLTEQDIQTILERVGPLETPPEEMTARVRANVYQAWQTEAVGRKTAAGPSNNWLRIAAAVAAISGTVYLGSLLQTTPQEAAIVATLDVELDVSSMTARLQTSEDGITWQAASSVDFPAGTFLKADQPVSMTLSNNMNTRLASGTVISLGDTDNISLMTGSIYADSYHQVKDSQFAIATEYGTARDIGTQFMVTAREDGWSVQVREGEVEIFDDGFADRLQPGERIVIAENNLVSEENVTIHDPSWHWTESARPAFNIDGRPVDEYLQWVARETGKELQYASTPARTSAEKSRLSGSISNLGATESLSHVLPATDLELIDSAENVIMVDLTSR